MPGPAPPARIEVGCHLPVAEDGGRVTHDAASTCQRALGFLELGMPQDAWEELGELPAEIAETSPVIQMKVEVLNRLKRWQDAAELCRPMIEREPGELFWWIQRAFSLRRSESIESAEAVLRSALVHHPPEGVLIYNLACYACVQGRLDEARDFLGRSISGDPDTIIRMALQDPDLAALRPWVEDLREDHRRNRIPPLPPKP